MQKSLKLAACLIFTAFLFNSLLAAASNQTFHHRMEIQLSPDNSEIRVNDQIQIPDHMRNAKEPVQLEFYLHAGLAISGVQNAALEADANEVALKSRPISIRHYMVTVPPGRDTFTLQYGGQIHHAVQGPGQEYARSFGSTPGVISPEGVFLASASAWYPQFGDALVSFQLDIQVPSGWDVVSQGSLLRENNGGENRRVVWEEKQPQDDIYLIAAKFQRYTQSAGAVNAMVYLRSADQPLAQKYLDATAQYIAMYNKLIGPYPYSKFALVENFWESGYGMPSFTLLGSKVIRLPFILHSSYPHEILHNYWGNGVFVDYAKG
ncbi:MAG: signal protein PDZ, partial [Betaproteobacteria bacterium]|nr:signal protein PDZ [Betaproteobacteria bacterium]